MRGKAAVALLALAGLLLAVSIGVAAYLVSRDSVGLPVTKLQPKPRNLAPAVSHKRTTTGATTTEQDRQRGRTQTSDDHSGSGSGSGSGRGGGGGGDD
jgi:uncharacterized membrane protein YgcG